MSARVRAYFKRALSRSLPDSPRLRYLAALPKLEKWRQTAGDCPLVATREDLYAFLQRHILKDEPIDYLEFGVFQGASLKSWLQLNSHPQSRFVGFDTFTGLPENWENFIATTSQHAFDMAGRLPNIADPRLTFQAGLFQETLPVFLKSFVPAHRLVVHNDCDLYSATLYVLTRLDSIMRPGTVVVFDEFSSIMHEFRALEDYCSAYRRRYRVCAASASATDYFTHLAIELS